MINLGVFLPIIGLMALILCLYDFYKKIFQKDEKNKVSDTKIIDELSRANLTKKMKNIEETDDYFKRFMVPIESIFDYSNRLMIEKETEENRKGLRNENEPF